MSAATASRGVWRGDIVLQPAVAALNAITRTHVLRTILDLRYDAGATKSNRSLLPRCTIAATATLRGHSTHHASCGSSVATRGFTMLSGGSAHLKVERLDLMRDQ